MMSEHSESNLPSASGPERTASASAEQSGVAERGIAVEMEQRQKEMRARMDELARTWRERTHGKWDASPQGEEGTVYADLEDAFTGKVERVPLYVKSAPSPEWEPSSPDEGVPELHRKATEEYIARGPNLGVWFGAEGDEDTYGALLSGPDALQASALQRRGEP
jgi:hypothetical protein